MDQSTGFVLNYLWLKSSISEFIFKYYKRDRVITLLSNTDEIIDLIHESFIKRYVEVDNDIKANGFSFDFIHSLYIECEKVNAPQRASFMTSPNWLVYKN